MRKRGERRAIGVWARSGMIGALVNNAAVKRGLGIKLPQLPEGFVIIESIILFAPERQSRDGILKKISLFRERSLTRKILVAQASGLWAQSVLPRNLPTGWKPVPLMSMYFVFRFSKRPPIFRGPFRS